MIVRDVPAEVALSAGAYDRALLSLSRGGADAQVVREFDLTSKSFVADGFGIRAAQF